MCPNLSTYNLCVSPNHELLPKYSEVPWKNVMGVRDFIVHHYFEVDADVIFEICKNDVPVLISVINRMIGDLRKA